MSPSHFVLSSAFMLGLAGLAFYRTYILSALLCLEGLMLSLFIGLSLWPLQFDAMSSTPLPMIMLAFSACEAGVGLALLVATTRTHGTSRLKNLSLLQC
uniref:NADH-ubiquinone oxidoreductase chain 4L n=1 Tax=Poeciliopsis sonoriensis TaxID=188138 RepID=A0A5P8HB72_9TELE|nr:NADH dehydrogenase subunit 4L [Poeciliopsis sonoriensis]